MFLLEPIRPRLRSPLRALVDFATVVVVVGLVIAFTRLTVGTRHAEGLHREPTTPLRETWASVDRADQTLNFSRTHHRLNNAAGTVGFVAANVLTVMFMALYTQSRYLETSIRPLVFIAIGASTPLQVLANDSVLTEESTVDNGLPLIPRKTLLIVCLLILIFAGVAFYTPIGIGKTIVATASGDTNQGVTQARCFSPVHALDIFMLVSCSQRFVVSVGFDRQIRLWDLTTADPTSQLVVPTAGQNISWPVSLVALDDHGEWLAVCSQGGRIVLWNCRHRRFGRQIPNQTDSKVSACFFVTTHWRGRVRSGGGSGATTRLLIVLESGNLVDIDVEGAEVAVARICVGIVQHPYLSWTSQLTAPKLLTVATDGSVFISANREGSWTTQQLRIAAIDRMTTTPSRTLRCVVVPSLRGVALMHDEDTSALHLVDMFSDALIHTFHPEPFRQGSLRAFHPQPQQCIYCGSTAVSSFSIAYTERGDGGSFSMTTVAAPRRNASQQYLVPPICLRSERDARERRCEGFTFGVESSYSLENPGVWEATGANGVAGVRRRKSPPPMGHTRSSSGVLTYRGKNRGQVQKHATPAKDLWEAWSMTALGVVSFHELAMTGLPAQEPGPACRLARNAVAVGLANSLVVVQFGSLLRDDDGAGGLPSELLRGRLSRRNSRMARTSSKKGLPD